MENLDSLLDPCKQSMEKALDHYRAIPNVHTWQKFHQALKQYIQVLDEQEEQKQLRYHEYLQKLAKTHRISRA